MTSTNRRGFLQRVLSGAAGLSLSRAFAQGAPIATVKLSDNCFEFTGAGSNVLAVATSDGLVMVDGGLPDRSAELLKVVYDQTKQTKVAALFNTHWHLESTGSNETLRKSGAKIIAHENTKLWMGTDIDEQWQKRTYQPRPDALPNATFYTSGKMTFGEEGKGTAVEYGYMPQAHTDGDIYVFFPAANILMAGDVVTVGAYPILDWSTGGWIGGLVDAQKALLKVANAGTRIIPGIGPVLTRADLQAQSEMFATIRERLVKLLRMGLSPKEMIAAAPTKEFDEKWGNPELFIAQAYKGLWGHVRELGGIV